MARNKVRGSAPLLLLAALTIGGCSSPPPDRIVIPTTSTPAPPPAVQVADPASIDIPRLGARSSLIKLGLIATGPQRGEMETPDVAHPQIAGFYCAPDPTDGHCRAINPGQIGSSVIIAHVDGNAGHTKGLFYRLRDLVPGDTVHVTQVTGTVLTFKVTKVQTVPKSQFPTSEVYGPVPDPELVLITCTGKWTGNRAIGYADNLIVRAALV